MAIDQTRMDELLGRAVVDIGATMHAACVVIGDRLGLYRAIADGGTLTSEDLARRTGTQERYVREWLASQAAGGYVTYHPQDETFSLSEEQSLALADEGSPAFLPGAFQVATAAVKNEPRVAAGFVNGDGVGWHEHDHSLFVGTERFFRPSYAANLVESWIPSLDGVEERLRRGARVADVGCGHGASAIIMAEAYPESTFIGFDYHRESIERAREAAEQAGVADRVSFEVASATEFGGARFDMICTFDCLHDMGDPAAAARHVRRSLERDGTWMIVEPFASDRLEENLNPVGRVFYSVSTLVCVPASLSQDGRAGLGAQAGEAIMRDVVTAGGFGRFRRAAETPFNLVLEARP